jgi:hypothetical protein
MEQREKITLFETGFGLLRKFCETGVLPTRQGDLSLFVKELMKYRFMDILAALLGLGKHPTLIPRKDEIPDGHLRRIVSILCLLDTGFSCLC